MYFFQTTKDSCFKKCTKMADPVCVNNHIEYINECQMEVITCQDGIQVNIKTKGLCPPEPCDSRGEYVIFRQRSLHLYSKVICCIVVDVLQPF